MILYHIPSADHNLKSFIKALGINMSKIIYDKSMTYDAIKATILLAGYEEIRNGKYTIKETNPNIRIALSFNHNITFNIGLKQYNYLQKNINNKSVHINILSSFREGQEDIALIKLSSSMLFIFAIYIYDKGLPTVLLYFVPDQSKFSKLNKDIQSI